MSKLNSLTTLALTLVLAACSGSSDSLVGGGGGGGNPTDPPPEDAPVRMGSGSGDSFEVGVIAASQANLPAGGSASLTVTFVDASNTLVGDTITVNFTSPCVAGGLANIVESTVTTETGSATATYSATGCAGDDTIRATANVGGVVLQATTTVNVEPAEVGSMNFVSAIPTNIGLKGTGGAGRQETSTVRFRVTDDTGGPVAGATVNFSLNTTVGGIELTPTSVTSDAQGFAQTVISAGSVATSVRVTAVVAGTNPVIGNQSDQLTITTGIPDDDSVSLSLGCTNLEAWAIDGQTTNATIRMSDRFNNPVPDGTAVTFTAEGGQIGGSCQTTTTPNAGGGVCSVTWVSQSPRLDPEGRVTILASAIGEESFVDADSNGRFNAGDTETPLSEPFRDDNEDGIRDANEPFRDFNTNGSWDDATAPDYLGFNGLLCDGGCAPRETLFVSDSIILVMSNGAAIITDNVGGAIDLSAGNPSVQSFTLSVGDNKGNGSFPQPMAGGSTVQVETSNGNIVGPSVYTVPCSTFDGPLNFTFTIEADEQSDSGSIIATVESPSGIVTTYGITVTD